jgi:hypothetical protein
MTLAPRFYDTSTTAFDYLQARAPRSLWAAVLEQAIKDIVEEPKPGEIGQKLTWAEFEKLRGDLKAAAAEWVADEENEPRRFVWVCDQLGLDPSAVRNEIKRRTS